MRSHFTHEGVMDAFAFRFHQSGQVEREGEGEGGSTALQRRSVRGEIALARSRSLGNVNFESGPLKKRIHREEEGSSSTSLRLSYSEGLRILWRGLVSNGRRRLMAVFSRR